MLKKLIIASLLLSSSSVFAATTTTTTSFSSLSDPKPANNYLTGNYAFLLLDPTLTNNIFDLSGSFSTGNKALNGLALFDGTTNTTLSFTTSATANNTYSFSALNLSAGSYELRFNVASGGGTIGGNYSVSTVTSAVPEPETYGMMLVGLGLMSVIAFRRQKNS